MNNVGSIAPVGPTNGTQQQTDQSSSAVGQLTQNDFLNLLVAQLQNQDPLSPMDNNEFISQTAQFSQVEQLTSLVSLTQQILQVQTQNSQAAAGGATSSGTNADSNSLTSAITQALSNLLPQNNQQQSNQQ